MQELLLRISFLSDAAAAFSTLEEGVCVPEFVGVQMSVPPRMRAREYVSRAALPHWAFSPCRSSNSISSNMSRAQEQIAMDYEGERERD